MKLQLKSKCPFLPKVIYGCWIFSLSIRRRRKQQCDRYIEDSKEAAGASVEEEDHAESLKQLQESMALSKSEWK